MSVEGLPATLEAIEQRKQLIVASVRAALARLTIKLQGKVKGDKLTGQVLNVRTGRLRRSITQRVEEQGQLLVGLVGTNVEYGAAHELGLTKDEQIRAHMRKITQAWGKQLKNPHAVQVRAHTRHVNLPPRSFLGSALQEMEGVVKADLAAAMERPDGAGS